MLSLDQPEDRARQRYDPVRPGRLPHRDRHGRRAAPSSRTRRISSSLYGKILRIDVDSGDPYAIPPDNPYINAPDARPEVWAYGLRNPWRFAFDARRATSLSPSQGSSATKWVHHQGSGPDGAARGVNFGWPIYEGFHCFDIPSGMVDENGDCALPPDYKAPIFEYPRGQDGGCVIIGGSVYRGPAIPALQGAYLYSDFCSGVVSAAWLDGDNGWQTLPLADLPGLVSSFGEDGSGELYVMNISEGLIYKMVPA
ncbi:MAG: PQQ-dependent sugar dehydrogenase [Thermomicrobiales bacterium]